MSRVPDCDDCGINLKFNLLMADILMRDLSEVSVGLNENYEGLISLYRDIVRSVNLLLELN